MVKEEFKDIESHDGGGLNLIVIRDTQSSRKRFYWAGEDFFLTFGFKDVYCASEGESFCLTASILLLKAISTASPGKYWLTAIIWKVHRHPDGISVPAGIASCHSIFCLV